jgi:oxygen-independent coproporphyrinogen-3 oxidase
MPTIGKIVPIYDLEAEANSISLYFHLPFCTKKCAYCHFYVLPNKDPLHHLLLEGLTLDLELWAPQLVGKKIISIYFGGGTPSLLHPAAISTLLDKVKAIIPFDRDSIEITLEANPETVSHGRMQEFASAGINRASIGIQTLDDALLAKLGRTHRAATAIGAVETAAQAGLKNVSIDLMYDIPGQTLASWQHTLHQIGNLPISHLSLYNLTIEPHTVFFKYREKLLKELPDAESSARMYESAVEILNARGLEQYEISAFARQGLYSRHNVGYWIARPFLGFGPSAFSYWEGSRFRSIAHLHRYVHALREHRSPIDFSEKLSPPQHRRELLAIAMRLRAGVDLEAFEQKHGQLDTALYAALGNLQVDGLVEKREGRIALTERGVLFYDTVAIEIV